MQTLDTFNELIDNLNDPSSDDTMYAMRRLHIHNQDIPKLIGLRMQYHYPFFNSVNQFMFNQAESEKNEKEFAATVGLDPNLWVAFVTTTREAVQNAQQQQQQEQQQQQQQRQMHDENWQRIIGKLSNCDTATQNISQYLNVPCDIFINILVKRGKALKDSVYSDQLNDDDETRFVNEVVNPMINPQLMVNPVKWIEVIKYLRFSLRSQYQQPDASFEDQDSSRLLEPSIAPSSGRPTPVTRRRRIYKDDIPSVPDKKLDTIEASIVDIFNTPPDVFTHDEDVSTPEYDRKYQYYTLISNILNTHKPPIITSEEYALLFGDVQQHTTLQPVHLLLNLFNKRFPDFNADESFAFACRAYIDANPDTIYFLISLEEQNPKTFYVIARLMHSFATNKFDRNFGKKLGGKSRSKKRGRKSVHRRKKSMHKKRK